MAVALYVLAVSFKLVSAVFLLAVDASRRKAPIVASRAGQAACHAGAVKRSGYRGTRPGCVGTPCCRGDVRVPVAATRPDASVARSRWRDDTRALAPV